MRITAVTIENFRSIKLLTLRDLGPFVVLYGPNGAGKSNILRAIERGIEIAAGIARDNFPDAVTNPSWLLPGEIAPDFAIGADRLEVWLEIDVAGSGWPIPGAAPLNRMELRVSAERLLANEYRFTLESWTATGPHAAGGADLRVVAQDTSNIPSDWPGMKSGDSRSQKIFVRQVGDALRRLLVETIGQHAFHRVEDVRAFGHRREGARSDVAAALGVPELLAEGRVEEAISRAATSSDDHLRDGFARLRDVLTNKPLSLPDIEAIVTAGDYRLRVRTTGHSAKRPTVASTAASLGTQQILILLGTILFRQARTYALEEPEAHLHAPTSGRALREVLKKLVSDGDLDQLFIATHSNLFDLDDQGFWSVSLNDGATTATYETELSKIDALHLFEPGAAKRVLQDVLRFGDPAEVIAFDGEGLPITAASMLRQLQEDTPDAMEYARALSTAAARMFLRERPKLVKG